MTPIARLVTCGLIAAPVSGLLSAPWQASASPCDDPSCVPNVARNVVQGAACTPAARYVFGLDAEGNTLICLSWGTWTPSAPLIGIRSTGASCCDGGRLSEGAAQSPEGIPLTCTVRGWQPGPDVGPEDPEERR
jgi:hypothetical protein